MSNLSVFLRHACPACGSVHSGACDVADVERWRETITALARERHADEKRERLHRHRLAVMRSLAERNQPRE